jgi:hypothetical protein
MKSRITIDLDYDNQPIITIEYQASEDVRDKMVGRFLGQFGGDSSWAHFNFESHGDKGNSVAKIRPISAYNLPEEVIPMIGQAQNHIKERQRLQKDFPDSAPTEQYILETLKDIKLHTPSDFKN